MNNETISANTITLRSELVWFDTLLRYRAYHRAKLLFEENRGTDPGTNPFFDDVRSLPQTPIDPPLPREKESVFGDFLRHSLFDVPERTAIILSLFPHIFPGALEQYAGSDHFLAILSELALKKTTSGRMLPTGETLLYLLAGTDLELRLKLLYLFDKQHLFFINDILALEEVPSAEPGLSGVLKPSRGLLDIVALGYIRRPDFSPDFPAKLISTDMEWDDLVLGESTKQQVEDLRSWLRYRSVVMNDLGMGRKMKKGFKALFYGPPGTGKTLTAAMLGKELDKDVYRIDLSMISSKYIGETEKNLAKIFDRADRSDWILFFDEADALFGKRTVTESSNDRYANQEVSYLLQRVEEYAGVAILASNFKANIDQAFLRRFNSIVYFPFPKKDERLRLWKSFIPEKVKLAADLNLMTVAEKYELTGAHVVNIVSDALIKMLGENKNELDAGMIHFAVVKELAKEGKTV
ncbi:MAG: ATP-binding protein [Bacteroidia bacterium]